MSNSTTELAAAVLGPRDPAADLRFATLAPHGRSWISLWTARRDSPGFCNRTQRKHRPILCITTEMATADAMATGGLS